MTKKAAVEALPPRFVKVTPQGVRKRLILSVEGDEGSGKTHFSFTAPGPIGYASFDVGDEGVIDKFAGDKDIYRLDYRLQLGKVKDKASKGNEDVIPEAVALRDQYEEDYGVALQRCRSFVVDTGSELWGTYRLATFGRLTKIMPTQYEEVNARFREMIRRAYESDCNLILLHKLKDVYEGTNKTGARELAGFGDIRYLTQINLRAIGTPKEGGGVAFSSLITKCRLKAELTGMALDDLTFPLLAAMATDTDEEDWL